MFTKVCFILGVLCLFFWWVPFVNFIAIPLGLLLMIPAVIKLGLRLLSNPPVKAETADPSYPERRQHPSVPTRQAGSIFGLSPSQPPLATRDFGSEAGTAPPPPQAHAEPADVPARPEEPTLKDSSRTVGEQGRNAPPLISAPVQEAEVAESSRRSATQSQNDRSGRLTYTYDAPGQPLCPECGERPVIFYCSQHSQGLCLECVTSHDRAGECFYVPGWRGGKR